MRLVRMHIRDDEITAAEQILLPPGCTFNDEARAIIRCWESKDVTACPGSGKTTVLLAKLKLLADRMPFRDGAGICVLSHTNVAVNEIKSKMAREADVLMSYPNFVGTLQSFVDKYIALPYLRTLTSIPIRPMESRAYATLMMDAIKNNRSYCILKRLLDNQYAQSGGQYKDEIDFLEGVQLKDDGLYPARGKKMAGRDKPSSSQYEKVVRQLLVERGVIRFSDAYRYAIDAIKNLDESYLALFSKRFKYVFIDEYQDCSPIQREVVDKIFPTTQCTVFKIGDVDQSIFNGKDEAQLWEPQKDNLTLSHSNRYSQEIADVLVHLRTGKERIVSNTSASGQKPVLIVFDIDNPSCVIPRFIEILDQKGFTDPNGIYKVIGKIKNGSGLKIGDYWEGFVSNNQKSNNNYWTHINNIQLSLLDGKLYLAEIHIKKLMCEILHLLTIKNESDRYYTTTTVKEYLFENGFESYGNSLFKLASLPEINRSSVDAVMRELLTSVVSCGNGESYLEFLPVYFMEEIVTPEASDVNNIYSGDAKGRRIVFDTVHGVKGETHDATLYLETFEQNGRDIKRILPLLTDRPVANRPVIEYARRCVYVGLSRPKKLLCVAITGDTYESNKDAFKDWEVTDIRV